MENFIYNNSGKILFSLIIGLLGAMVFVCYESPEKKQSLYDAWCKVNNNTNITFAEWSALRSDGLLPGQTKKSTTVVPVVTPIYHR